MSDAKTPAAIALQFDLDAREVRDKVTGEARLLAYAIVAIVDDGKDVGTIWTVERHGAGIADRHLEHGIELAQRHLVDGDAPPSKH